MIQFPTSEDIRVANEIIFWAKFLTNLGYGYIKFVPEHDIRYTANNLSISFDSDEDEESEE